ncbi:MAG: hypothetical protein V8S22_03380 [Lachnospiraceae bacterium]
MMMMEYNNYEIADLIEAWLIGHGLTAEPVKKKKNNRGISKN